MNRNLERLLREKREDFTRTASSAQKRKKSWLGDIRIMLDNIRTWLNPLVRAEYLSLSDKRVRIVEPELGSYEAPALQIKFFNGAEVHVVPKALQAIGTDGRIDIDLGESTIYIVRDPVSHMWDLVDSRVSPQSKEPFDQSALERVLEEVVASF